MIRIPPLKVGDERFVLVFIEGKPYVMRAKLLAIAGPLCTLELIPRQHVNSSDLLIFRKRSELHEYAEDALRSFGKWYREQCIRLERSIESFKRRES